MQHEKIASFQTFAVCELIEKDEDGCADRISDPLNVDGYLFCRQPIGRSNPADIPGRLVRKKKSDIACTYSKLFHEPERGAGGEFAPATQNATKVVVPEIIGGGVPFRAWRQSREHAWKCDARRGGVAIEIQIEHLDRRAFSIRRLRNDERAGAVGVKQRVEHMVRRNVLSESEKRRRGLGRNHEYNPAINSRGQGRRELHRAECPGTRRLQRECRYSQQTQAPRDQTIHGWIQKVRSRAYGDDRADIRCRRSTVAQRGE
ncbi:MAG TPA: hypothetical protein VN634_12055 [Candidatus Limnocylindrales bacterium]|nr:hypothetical protein [Candidatus Limnocylindrales bacterium]